MSICSGTTAMLSSEGERYCTSYGLVPPSPNGDDTAGANNGRRFSRRSDDDVSRESVIVLGGCRRTPKNDDGFSRLPENAGVMVVIDTGR